MATCFVVGSRSLVCSGAADFEGIYFGSCPFQPSVDRRQRRRRASFGDPQRARAGGHFVLRCRVSSGMNRHVDIRPASHSTGKGDSGHCGLIACTNVDAGLVDDQEYDYLDDQGYSASWPETRRG